VPLPEPFSLVFISHSDQEVALEIDHLIERAFDGHVRTFNTSRYDRGLTPGDNIDPALLAEIERSDTFLSLWTPASIAKSSWMAWELGAAVALRRRVFVARALGVQVRDLPLNLSTRHAPDLGDADQVMGLFRAMAGELQVDFSESTIREESARHSAHGAPSPLRARVNKHPRVDISLHGPRGMIENVSTYPLAEISVSAERGGADADLADCIRVALLERTDRTAAEGAPPVLRPNERVVFQVPQAPEAPERSTLQFEWTVVGVGREQQELTIPRPATANKGP
jgi:hypothetical protein